MIGVMVVNCRACGEVFVLPGREHQYSECDNHTGVTTLDEFIEKEAGA